MQKANNSLRTIRKMLGKSIAELATESGVSVSIISAYETGRREITIKTLRPIAEALGTTASVILSNKKDAVIARRKRSTQKALKYQALNPDKVQASYLARYNADNLTILYECSCNNGSPKEKHHHDYTKPLEVMLLCHACHMKWHSRIRNQSSPALPDTTAQVIDTCIGCGGQAGDQTQ